MLGNHFYHNIIRRYVICIGTLFNQISIVRYRPGTDIEAKRILVPIIYGPKEKWFTRFESDPDLIKETQTTLPRMSFYLTNISYDAARKQNQLLKVAKGDSTSRVATQWMGVPYDFDFELVIYARNIDDGTHVIEQILPYFNPDYTIPITPVPELGFLKDIAITLNRVDQQVQYEGDWNSARYVYWTLSLTVKGWLYGPISTPKIIRKSIANIFNDPSLVTGYIVKINTGVGNNGTFKINDTVYQGGNSETANAYGQVLSWSPGTGKLVVGGAQGNFKLNNIVRGTSTNAAYQIASFDASPIKLAQITVEPNPIDAQPGGDYGYSTQIIEYPDTEN